MNVLLILALCVAVAYAGVQPWNQRDEDEAIRLFLRYCSGNSEQGSDGSTFFYCKRSRDQNQENLQHSIVLSAPPSAPRQVVFVQPPPTLYKHNVIISGQSGQQQKTSIYVLPQKADHTLEYEDKRVGDGKPEKPSLFFLKNNPGESTDSTPGNPPPGGYLPPKENKPGYRYDTPAAPLGYA